MRFVVAVALVAGLSGCGGSPMSVESRWVDDRPRELSVEERLQQARMRERAQGNAAPGGGMI